MQDFGNSQRQMLDRIRRLEVRLGSIAIGNKIAPTAYSGILPQANGGTASGYGPMQVTAMWTNNSGGALNNGDVVVLDFSGARRVDDTTTARNKLVAGVVRGTGPFANGDQVPVLSLGYHTALKVTGTVAAGDWLVTSTTSARAAAGGATYIAGAFARAFTANPSGTGTVEAFVYPTDILTVFQQITASGQLLIGSGNGRMDMLGAPGANGQVLVADSAQTLKMLWRALTFLELSDTPSTYAGSGGLAVKVNAGATGLEFGAVSSVTDFLALTDTPNSYAGQALKAVRVNAGETALEFTDFPGGTSNYDPRLKPSVPSATDDEFDDNVLDAAWIAVNSGGATRAVSETDRKGFVHITNLDGGGGSDTGIYKAYVPGAAAFTIVGRVFGDVRNAGSNQANMYLYDGSGNFIYGVGMLNGSLMIVSDSGGFRSYNVTYATPNIGEVWVMIQRDASTNYQAFVSSDGMTWARLEGANRSGTVGRVRLMSAAFGASNAEAWWDFIRMFTTQTFTIGGTGQGSATLTAHDHSSSVQGGLIRLASNVLTAQGDILTRDATQIKRLAASVPAANVLNLLGFANGDVEPAWKTVLDATAPTTIAAGAVAAAGTALVFAHRDHVHGAPATWPATAHNFLSATHGDTTAAAAVRGDILTAQGAVTPLWTRLAASVPAANVLNLLGLANGDTEPGWKTVLDATNPASVTLSATPGTSLVLAHRDHGHALSVSIAPTWTGRHVFSGSATITTAVDAYINLTPTVTNNTGNAIALFGIQGALVGNGESPIALLVRPFFTPSANILEAFGGSLAAFINPPAGVTVAAAVGFRGILASSAGTGAITRASMLRADGFVNIGGPTPTNVIGLEIASMSGGTNNYTMAINEVDLTAEGTYYGRFSVLYNGLRKYVSLRNA